MKLPSAERNTLASTMFHCQTCNAIFTCLDIYQNHRKDHALKEGVKLQACAHCIYVSDNIFHYNWHVMSHAGQEPHSCEVCQPIPEVTTEGDWSTDVFGEESKNVGRISDSTISFGKRSIATQSSEDLIYPSSPPPPYHQNYPTKIIHNRGNIYNNLDTIDARHLLENQDDEEGDDDDDDDDDDDATQNDQEEDDNETEEEKEQVESTFPTECDNQNGGDAFNFKEEEEPVVEQQQTFDQQQFFDQQQMNGEQFEENKGEFDEEHEDEEDDGTVEDEEVQELIQEDEHQEFHEDSYENGEEEYQEDEEEEEEDDHDYEDDVAMDADDEELSEPARKVGDVYDFKSDEDEQSQVTQQTQPILQQFQPQQNVLQNGTQLQMPTQMQPQQLQQQPQQPPELRPTMVPGATNHNPHMQLQPTFVHHAPPPHPQHQQHPHHQQGLPALQPAPPHHHHPQGQLNLRPNLAPNLAPNATFQLPSHMSNQHHHPHQHHQPTFITINPGTGYASVPGPPGSGNYFQLETAGTNGQTIRLLFNPGQQQQQQHQHQGQVPQPQVQQQQIQQLQPAQPILAEQQIPNQQVVEQQPAAPAPTPTPSRRRSKKNANLVHSAEEINDHLTNGEIVNIQQTFVPTKGKGKGNRKPRINFISVINGVTVGADGIRRKFHCSHCGNGKSFKTKSHLQRHMLTHTGEKPYQCNECGSKFNQSSSLRNHIIAIHTKKFPHVCTVCGKGFLMPAVLQKHIQQTNHYAEGNGTSIGSTGSPSTHAHSEDANSKDDMYGEERREDEAMYAYNS